MKALKFQRGSHLGSGLYIVHSLAALRSPWRFRLHEKKSAIRFVQPVSRRPPTIEGWRFAAVFCVSPDDAAPLGLSLFGRCELQRGRPYGPGENFRGQIHTRYIPELSESWLPIPLCDLAPFA